MSDNIIYKKEACSNCGETRIHCACMRNICIDCGNPVGNITFSRCDACYKMKQQNADMLAMLKNSEQNFQAVKAKIAELQQKSPAYENDKIYISVACCNAIEAINELIEKVGGE